MSASASGLLYTSFNSAVLDFLDDLGGSFPSCKSITALKEFYEVAMKANKRAPLSMIHDLMMVPYGERIRKHDEEFFMARDFSEDLAAAGRAGAGAGAGALAGGRDVVGIIKGLWKDMTPADKECVFGHLDVIVDIYDSIQVSPGM
jgi:hypothetical protein